MEAATAAQTPESDRPKLPALAPGRKPPRHIRARNGVPLSLADVHAMAMWLRELNGNQRQAARACGVSEALLRRYVHEGSKRLGIPPLKLIAPEDLPPLPVTWRQRAGRIPAGSVSMDPSVEVEVPEGAEVLTPPPAAPIPAPPPPLALPPPAPQPKHPPRGPAEGSNGRPEGSGATNPPTSPPTPPDEAPRSSGVLKPIPGVDVGHTLPVANAEIVRVSRNTRALVNAKVRALAKLADTLKGDLGAKDAPKLTRSHRDLLMVLREIRYSAVDVERLYRLEAGILGIGQGAGITPPMPGEEEAPELGHMDGVSLEELEAQVRHLLGSNPNTSALAPDSPAASPHGGMPVTVHGSAFDRPGALGGTPPSGGTGTAGGPRGR